MSTGEAQPLPLRAGDTTALRPWPVRHVAPKVADYVARMPPVWVEGQVLNLRRWNRLVFLTLRDTDVDMSLKVTVDAKALDGLELHDGARLVVHARPRFYEKRGDLSFVADSAQLVGLGELLARLEHLKGVLGAEGLFDPARKKALPFLPHLVGLVCAQQGDAEHDVVTNARARWPGVRFEIRRVSVQGAHAVPEVTAALAELDADPRVDVIVVARGGGSFEDLLPFSNETLVRAAAACRTPVVSAIGHEQDTPLLDLVADVRASTPTDAGKRVVPDVTEERARLVQARTRTRAALRLRLDREHQQLDLLRDRPVLARPLTLLTVPQQQLIAHHERLTRAVSGRLDAARADLSRLVTALHALSPAATLDRGYAVVRLADGTVLRTPDQVRDGDPLTIRVAGGSLAAQVSRRAQPAEKKPATKRTTSSRDGKNRPG
ncbi:MAG: exodeoxyribonuclease VII large subunit [Micrococcales bacterium]|nr:exodeoxyribonuclease VII large subunit [Micrococcales bacterium]